MNQLEQLDAYYYNQAKAELEKEAQRIKEEAKARALHDVMQSEYVLPLTTVVEEPKEEEKPIVIEEKVVQTLSFSEPKEVLRFMRRVYSEHKGVILYWDYEWGGGFIYNYPSISPGGSMYCSENARCRLNICYQTYRKFMNNDYADGYEPNTKTIRELAKGLGYNYADNILIPLEKD
jgi:hypothetical protein